MREPEGVSYERASVDIEDELLSSRRELSSGLTSLDHLRWSPTIARSQPGPSRP
jgi:hypothetical protein